MGKELREIIEGLGGLSKEDKWVVMKALTRMWERGSIHSNETVRGTSTTWIGKCILKWQFFLAIGSLVFFGFMMYYMSLIDMKLVALSIAILAFAAPYCLFTYLKKRSEMKPQLREPRDSYDLYYQPLLYKEVEEGESEEEEAEGEEIEGLIQRYILNWEFSLLVGGMITFTTTFLGNMWVDLIIMTFVIGYLILGIFFSLFMWLATYVKGCPETVNIAHQKLEFTKSFNQALIATSGFLLTFLAINYAAWAGKVLYLSTLIVLPISILFGLLQIWLFGGAVIKKDQAAEEYEIKKMNARMSGIFLELQFALLMIAIIYLILTIGGY